MIRAITFIPASGDSGGLTYVERASRNRSLHVLLQDCRAAGAVGSPGGRRGFLQNAYREIISRYVSFGRIEHPLPLARELVSYLDSLSHRVDCRVDDFRGLGFYVLFQDGGVFYLLASREGRARIRTDAGLEPLSNRELPGVTELPVESASAQKELFSRDLRDFLVLYRIDAAKLEHNRGTLDLALGGNGEEMDTLVEALEQPGVIEPGIAEKMIPLNLISRKMMYLSFDGVVKVRDLYTQPVVRRSARPPSGRAVLYAASAAVVVLLVASAVFWLGNRRSGGSGLPAQSVETGRPGPAGGAGGGAANALSDDAPVATDSPWDRIRFAAHWTRTYEKGVTSSPLLSAGKIVFGGRNGTLYALEAGDGEPVWQRDASEGIGASPAVAAGKVVAADYRGNVFAVDLQGGETVWERKLPAKVVSSPCVGEGEVLVGCFDGYAYALSVETGRILWKVDTGARIRGTPAFADGVFYVPSYSGKMYAISAGTGSVRWTYNLQRPVSSSPAVGGGLVVVGGSQGGIYALETGSGELHWKFDTDQPVKSSVLVAEGRVLCGSNGGQMYCIDLESGEKVWSFETEGPVLARPCLLDGSAVFPSYDGRVYCVQFETGREIDRFNTGEPVYSSPAPGDNCVYFGTNEGKFFCLGLRGEGSI